MQHSKPFAGQPVFCTALYLLMTALSGSFIASTGAARFEMLTLQERLLAGLCYGSACTLLTFGYGFARRGVSWRGAILGAITMMAAASALYSLVRHETTLLVLPSLFSVPGAICGTAWAQSITPRTLKSESITALESDESTPFANQDLLVNQAP